MSKFAENGALAGVAILAIALLLVVTAAIYGGLVWLAWSFVVVPVFGAPPLTFVQCAIVGIVLGAFFGHRGGGKE